MKVFSLLIILATSLYAETPAPLNNEQLDLMIIKACTPQSNESACQSKMNAVRKGISIDELLAKAPKLPVDSEINVVVASDPVTFMNEYYCLAIYNQIITMKEVEADVFPYVVYGFSFGEVSVLGYNKWLATPASKSCTSKLKAVTPYKLIGNKKINIILNPITFMENGTGDEFLDLAAKIYNHERLHAIYATRKAKSKTAALWKSMTDGEKKQFKSEHPNYQFKINDILYRELFSYTFDSNPKVVYDFLESKEKLSYAQLKKSICHWCISDSDETLAKVKELAKLSPQDLLTSLEKDNIKVLILSSGRKNPSTLFHWGKVREDKGELTQISKIEGAMGKTLCKGERPEASDSTTIILASDSPYSTLLHEYLHVLQIRKDSSWCPVSKRLWTDPPLVSETRMIRDREWDVRVALWNLLDAREMNIEDQIIIAEGLLREGKARAHFDPSAKKLLSDKNVQAFLTQKIDSYQKSMTK